jgi:hypothetical protein
MLKSEFELILDLLREVLFHGALNSVAEIPVEVTEHVDQWNDLLD